MQRAFAALLARVSWLPMVTLVCAHVVFGMDDFPILARALLAVPGVLFVVEARTYLSSDRGELPFLPMAMLQFYTTWGFPVFFEGQFFDLSGPVQFTDEIRVQGGLVVALGALSVWGAAHGAMHLSRNLPRRALAILPPDTVASGWDEAFYVIVGLTVALIVLGFLFPSAMPTSVDIIVRTTLTPMFALGLAIVRPPRRLGKSAAVALTWLGVVTGMLQGQVDPMARSVMTFVSAQWAATRRLSFNFIVIIVGLFLVFQPMKIAYRGEVWGYAARTGEELGVAARLDALGRAFTNQYIDTSSSRRSGKGDGSALARLSELSPVMHAIVVVPTRVDYAFGGTLAQIVYAPIPRLIWPDKPVSTDEVAQHYAVIFGLQTQAGSETTAVGMCLLVEAYWNFGWFGIPLICGAIGLLVGAQQRLFSGSHWALRAAGVAQFSTLSMAVPMVNIYGSLFQLAVGRFLGIWLLYWLAQILGTKARRAPVGDAGRVRRVAGSPLSAAAGKGTDRG